MRTGSTFCRRLISKWRFMVRQSSGLLICGILLSACGDLSPSKGPITYLKIKGGVASDEPRSALVGKQVLTSGGNAVDALVAMYFALSVTYPVSGTLGGGGICIVHDGKDGTTAAIDFRPEKYVTRGTTVSIPGAVRGMYAIHARFGREKWEKLLIPAERLARFGYPVSRVLARRLAELPQSVFLHPTIRQSFTSNGVPLKEGHKFVQQQLSSIIEQVRLRGPRGFYAGDVALDVIAGMEETTNVAVPAATLTSYRPRWVTPKTITYGNRTMFVPGGLVGSEAVAMWRAAIKRRYTPVLSSNRSDSAGLSAIDVEGNAVACAVSANGVLGAKRMIGSTGILMANTNAERFPGLPIIFAHKYRTDAIGVVTGSGGSNAPMIAINRAARTFFIETGLQQSIKENGLKANVKANIIRCPKGSRRDPLSCEFFADPRGFGLAISASH